MEDPAGWPTQTCRSVRERSKPEAVMNSQNVSLRDFGLTENYFTPHLVLERKRYFVAFDNTAFLLFSPHSSGPIWCIGYCSIDTPLEFSSFLVPRYKSFLNFTLFLLLSLFFLSMTRYFSSPLTFPLCSSVPSIGFSSFPTCLLWVLSPRGISILSSSNYNLWRKIINSNPVPLVTSLPPGFGPYVQFSAS